MNRGTARTTEEWARALTAGLVECAKEVYFILCQNGIKQAQKKCF